MPVQALRRESPSVTEDQLHATLARMRAAFLREGPPSYRHRREQLDKLLAMVLDNKQRICEAICEDFGNRSPQESLRLEILPTVLGLKHTRRQLRRWMRPQRRGTHWAMWPSSGRVECMPLGVVGVISPWNYPIYLAIGPLTAALAAGNRALIKPSELTPTSSALLAELIGRTFDRDEVAVITGGVDTARAFASLPFDHLLFTGSTSVGRMVMRAASEHLVPVTLELGGKSPTVIDRDFPLDRAMGSLMLGKLYNAGQTCVAPDYLFVHESQQEQLLEQIRAQVAKMYPRLAANSDYTAIINERHRERLRGYLDDARDKGATLLEINPGDEAPERFADAGKLAPTLLLDVDDSMAVMQNEIFGPLLPIMTYRELDEAIQYINARPRPLAAYIYSSDRESLARFRTRVVSGGMAINSTMMQVAQDDLPFGGVGESGIGSYHAREGFETFSHQRGVFRQLSPNLVHLIAPPYEGALKRVLLDFLIRK
jgi:acyl-CoA reductase-like NAD-dependent aldehyde dehydrogenase